MMQANRKGASNYSHFFLLFSSRLYFGNMEMYRRVGGVYRSRYFTNVSVEISIYLKIGEIE